MKPEDLFFIRVFFAPDITAMLKRTSSRTTYARRDCLFLGEMIRLVSSCMAFTA